MSTLKEPMQGQLLLPQAIRQYVTGGNATFTLVSRKSGKRFTFQVKSGKKDRNANWSTGNQDKSMFFVSLLTGGDNESSYTYLGMLRPNRDNALEFSKTRGSTISERAESFRSFEWFWDNLEFGCQVSSQIEFWHEGRCCMCGRKLTVPSSVESGIGPECASKGGM